MLLTSKQSKGEPVEYFFGKLKEISQNCDFGNQENTLISDLFFLEDYDMKDYEIQKRLFQKNCRNCPSFLLGH